MITKIALGAPGLPQPKVEIDTYRVPTHWWRRRRYVSEVTLGVGGQVIPIGGYSSERVADSVANAALKAAARTAAITDDVVRREHERERDAAYVNESREAWIAAHTWGAAHEAFKALPLREMNLGVFRALLMGQPGPDYGDHGPTDIPWDERPAAQDDSQDRAAAYS